MALDWMSKIEILLNDFDPRIKSDWEYSDNIWLYTYKYWKDKATKNAAEVYICSRVYDFVGWLVREKHIDKDRVKEYWGRVKCSKWLNDFDKLNVDEYWTKRILMLLSLSEHPLTILSTYLK